MIDTLAVRETNLELPGRRQGKVRDIYEIPSFGPQRSPALLIIATDRISAFDVVLPTSIPGKGRLLTDISVHWMHWLESQGIVKSHLLSTDPHDLAQLTNDQANELEGRVMIGRRCRVIPVECVVRGYIEGSGWKDYQATQSICGNALPAGLRRGDELPQPIFTPATKAEIGQHDENINFEQACEIAGRKTMTWLRDKSLEIYTKARAYARDRGIILADTKFEFGIPLDGDGKPLSDTPILIDEALTPDSSRFWPLEEWTPGREQVSFDKQYVREFLESIVKAGAWNKKAPGPELPVDVVSGTIARYEEARNRLFGR